ncbi:hypothetical protein [Saccharococcus caldoxylosilyticus]|uniref:Uncharacterized protein n=2 Tax=Saccharococcus caldoxylosilyticus TaxID=81408 RepID=A0A023DA42_9BACL|nr:hypothetical protein [Parageobacillus caldoxylosilyticus]KYD15256.1 hypothetical protein B4119_3031 [Parageobacillus caldoxylosilyticus]MBB3850858.1 hypothetical protein [Parageobacillus caldoxylosilyticus]QXJ39344.1 hypothetical protein BV455_02710 [Parageobacillus caldoxylosilyticus]BDG36971.1 hypothetical protein PcaKH15_28770 [Parageobacillus caldoxylosilyticus]BDG40760.1 hypothetical protein PcaKH16_28990 [Parageobacillus caldoxylosilyticus]
MTVGEELDIESQLTFIPSDATDKRLDSVQSSAPEYVEARLQRRANGISLPKMSDIRRLPRLPKRKRRMVKKSKIRSR